MTGRKALLILNPIAGKGRAGERRAEVEALLGSFGLSYETRLTQGRWHAAELAREARREGFDLVIAAGGDGTANEVVNGLMLAMERGERPPALGVLPLGRGNDFAFGLGLSSRLEETLSLIAGGSTLPLDVGKIKGGNYPEGRYFGNGVGVGFDTRVGLEAARLKRVHGALAYVVGAAKVFLRYPEPTEIDILYGMGRYLGPSHQISVMNGRRMGGSFHMAPEALPHDGLFDLCLAGALSRREMIGLILRYTKGTQAGHPKILTGRAARFEIQAPRGGLVVHADGETICEDGSSLLIECLSGALSAVRSERA